MEVKRQFTGTKWFVEGDIKGCFDNVDHSVLVGLLRRRIRDEHFLGLFSCKEQPTRKDPRGHTGRALSGHIMLYVLKEKWLNKLISYDALKITGNEATNYKEVWESLHRKHLLHLDDLEIMRRYNAEIREIYNYYRIANNATVLDAFGYIMKYSMYRTLAAKYHSSVRRIRRKYSIGKDFGVRYQTKTGPKVMLF